MWGGNYVVGDIEHFIQVEELLGLSTYLCHEDFETEDNRGKGYIDKVKVIVAKSKVLLL
jgi:hypothetical protein